MLDGKTIDTSLEEIKRMERIKALEKVYEFVRQQEDLFYEPIETGKYEIGSMAHMQCLFQAVSFQKVRYFLESLMEI